MLETVLISKSQTRMPSNEDSRSHIIEVPKKGHAVRLKFLIQRVSSLAKRTEAATTCPA